MPIANAIDRSHSKLKYRNQSTWVYMMIKKYIRCQISTFVFSFFARKDATKSVCVCVCVVTHGVVIPAAPSPSPHLGRLNIVSFQPGLGACGWPRWIKPCFCSAHLRLSLFFLSPSVHSKDETRPLWFCPAQRSGWQSDSVLGYSLSCGWATRHCQGWLSWAPQDQACVFQCLSSRVWNFLSLFTVVEDDEDDFPSTRTDGEFLHSNGSKEKCE